jgi:hypothetical protein
MVEMAAYISSMSLEIWTACLLKDVVSTQCRSSKVRKYAYFIYLMNPRRVAHIPWYSFVQLNRPLLARASPGVLSIVIEQFYLAGR